MSRPEDLSRRTFLKAGMGTVALAGLSLTSRADEPDPQEHQEQPAEKAEQHLVPERVLGRTGAKISILMFGAGRRPSRRTLNATYDSGIRAIDTARNYAQGKSETSIGRWMSRTGRRKEFFIATKDLPNSPEEWVEMADQRLEALQTDYIDLFFIHSLGEDAPGRENMGMAWPKSKAWRDAAEQMKKSGKIRSVGFTTHVEVPLRLELLSNAVEGGWTDAIMVASDPELVRTNAEFNEALDACAQANIGLICMKSMRGAAHAPKFMPEFEEEGLTAQQAVLHAVWSDERFASIVSDMPNMTILEENAAAAKTFKPMDEKAVGAVLEMYKRLPRTYCNACDGRCRRAAGTKAALASITRYLSYYEIDGRQDEARALFAALASEQRDWRDADLDAASKACLCKLDFASLLPRAEQKLA